MSRVDFTRLETDSEDDPDEVELIEPVDPIEPIEDRLDALGTVQAMERLSLTKSLGQEEWRVIALASQLDTQLAEALGKTFDAARQARLRATRRLKAALASPNASVSPSPGLRADIGRIPHLAQ